MSSQLNETQKRRYEKIVSHANEIWKLEKEKFNLRDVLEIHRKDIADGVVAAGSYDFQDRTRSTANILGAREREKSTQKAIEEIRNQQLVILKNIEEIILL